MVVANTLNKHVGRSTVGGPSTMLSNIVTISHHRNEYDTKRYDGFRSKWDDAVWNHLAVGKDSCLALVITVLNRLLSEMRKILV
jgi:hypothetical protein